MLELRFKIKEKEEEYGYQDMTFQHDFEHTLITPELLIRMASPIPDYNWHLHLNHMLLLRPPRRLDQQLFQL